MNEKEYGEYLFKSELQRAFKDIFKHQHVNTSNEACGATQMEFDLSSNDYEKIINSIEPSYNKNIIKQYFIMSNKTKKYLESQFPPEPGYDGDDAVIKFYGIDVAISNSIEYKKVILLNTFLC